MSFDPMYGAYKEGGYYMVDPSSKNRNWHTQQNWNKYINQVGHSENQLIDLNKRSYKTTWIDPNEYQHGSKWGQNFTGVGRNYNFVDKHGEEFTGRQRTNIEKWNKYDDDNPTWRGYGGWQRNEHEILDWGAYNRDALYSRALQQRHGRNQFKTLQDIHDAEDVMSGNWSRPAPPPSAPAPVQAPPRVDIEAQLKAMGVAHEKAIGGWRDELSAQKLESSRTLEKFITDFNRQRQESQSQFNLARDDWSRQQQGLQTSLAESNRQAGELRAEVKANEERAIERAERARVAASYGSQGKPLNKEVQGVKTLNELTPASKRQFGATASFNRTGSRLKIRNLNV
jgi:hypothetical protein